MIIIIQYFFNLTIFFKPPETGSNLSALGDMLSLVRHVEGVKIGPRLIVSNIAEQRLIDRLYPAKFMKNKIERAFIAAICR